MQDLVEEMEKVVGKRCPMCNNQKGMGAPPKPKPKVVTLRSKGKDIFLNYQADPFENG